MHNHNHNPDATWETQLVIPEAIKSVEERTLDAVLRIEGLLQARFAPGHTDLMVDPETIATLSDEEMLEIQQVRETTKPKKAKAK